jgi:hypothetical protein
MTTENQNEQTATDATATTPVTTGLPTTEETTDIETERVPRNWKRTALWSGLLVLALIAIGFLCVPIFTSLSKVSKSAVPTKGAVLGTTVPVTVQANGQETTVVVPAVRGVDATSCSEDDLVIEGNRLVFKNGCAKPVFYGK